MRILEQAVGQLLALIAFFAFPASQYILLKWLTRKEGQPELWYLPDHGFRLVIRNLPRKKTLTDINYRVIFRHVIPPSRAHRSRAFMMNNFLPIRIPFFFPERTKWYSVSFFERITRLRPVSY